MGRAGHQPDRRRLRGIDQTVAYMLARRKIASCRLTPFDQAQFDAIWS